VHCPCTFAYEESARIHQKTHVNDDGSANPTLLLQAQYDSAPSQPAQVQRKYYPIPLKLYENRSQRQCCLGLPPEADAGKWPRLRNEALAAESRPPKPPPPWEREETISPKTEVPLWEHSQPLPPPPPPPLLQPQSGAPHMLFAIPSAQFARTPTPQYVPTPTITTNPSPFTTAPLASAPMRRPRGRPPKSQPYGTPTMQVWPSAVMPVPVSMPMQMVPIPFSYPMPGYASPFTTVPLPKVRKKKPPPVSKKSTKAPQSEKVFEHHDDGEEEMD